MISRLVSGIWMLTRFGERDFFWRRHRPSILGNNRHLTNHLRLVTTTQAHIRTLGRAEFSSSPKIASKFLRRTDFVRQSENSRLTEPDGRTAGTGVYAPFV